MQIKIFEKGFNFSQDGPGNRLVYHLQGCNLVCPWCSNPEGMEKNEAARTLSLEETVSEILSCRPMYFGGGGVTFTGGECSLQSAALLSVIGHMRDAGVSVAIESNAATDGFLPLARAADYVILDYKSPSAEVLRATVGGNLERIEENIRAILKEKAVHIRIPLIHGFNDTDGDAEGFAAFFSSLSGDFDVEILPYHEYGREKWKKCGREYTVTDGHVPRERVEHLQSLLRAQGIKIIKT